MKTHHYMASPGTNRIRTACGKQAWVEQHTPSEASLADGSRIEITDDKHKATCKRCRPTGEFK